MRISKVEDQKGLTAVVALCLLGPKQRVKELHKKSVSMRLTSTHHMRVDPFLHTAKDIDQLEEDLIEEIQSICKAWRGAFL